jgi:hypothetical protein
MEWPTDLLIGVDSLSLTWTASTEEHTPPGAIGGRVRREINGHAIRDRGENLRVVLLDRPLAGVNGPALHQQGDGFSLV